MVDSASDHVRQFDRKLREWRDPLVVGRLFAKLDAVSSSGAEGSTTTFSDLLEYESSLASAPDVADAATVAALSDATMASMTGSIEEVLLGLHRRLFEGGDRRQVERAGRYKASVNGTHDPEAPGGMFTYTRPESVPMAMREWETFVLDRAQAVPDLLRQVLGHWMFEHVHPFHDGNGQIGRLLVPVVLARKGFTGGVSAFVSEGVYLDKELYVEGLKRARTSGDMLGWTRMMLGFVERGAKANLSRLEGMSVLRDEWEGKVSDVRSDSVIHRLVPFVLTRPAFTIDDACREVGGTFASVNGAVAKLVEKGVVSSQVGTRRGRLFRSEQVLALFENFRAPSPSEEAQERHAP